MALTQMLPLDAERLIPHRAPMRLIDELIEVGPGFARARVRFGVDHIAVADGRVIEPALVECAAQTVAGGVGYAALQNPEGEGERKLGMLTGVSDFEIHRLPAAESTLLIEVREEKKLGSMRLVSAKITCDGELVAQGQLKVYG